MKKFSTRKIASLALVFCLFLSVFANAGIFTTRAEGTVTVTFNLVDGNGGLYNAISTGYQISDGSWPGGSWQTDSDEHITFTNSETSCSVSWDSSDVTEVWLQVSGWAGDSSWVTFQPNVGHKSSTTYNLYVGADGTSFTTTDPNAAPDDDDTTGTTGTATITYMGEGTGWWMGIDGAYDASGTWISGSGWLAGPGSNSYVNIALNDNVYTLTWDTTAVSGAYAKYGNSVGSWEARIANGDAIVLYDDASGLTTTKPAPVHSAMATINYHGTGSPSMISNGYSGPSGWVADCNTWQTASDENITFGQSGSTYTLAWSPDTITEIYLIIGGTPAAGGWVSDFKITLTDGAVFDIYDTADGSNFTTEAPSSAEFTATTTITYMGSQSVWTGSDGAWVIADNAWTNSWLAGPGSNDYAAISHVGNVYTIKWDPNTANPNFRFGVTGDFEDEFEPELTDGAAYTLYDDTDNGKLVTELPAKYASASIVYMGNKSTWTSAYGLTPARTDINGWWINDSASPDAPVGDHIMYSGNGNTHTYTWDADLASTCWVLFGSTSYEGDAPYFGMKDGAVIYIYDKDVLGRLSTDAPKMVTSTVVVDSEDSTWAGITALCTADGNWISGLWIDNDSNDYGITVTKTVADGKTTYTYTYDMSQITTVCTQVGTTNADGGSSNIWINLSGNTTRNVYITEDTHEVTTFPAGYSYVKPGTGEGMDGTVKVHYIREDGDYSNWYFGYWYQVDGEWLSFNNTFSSDGTFTLALNDIPAAEIGFVINYNNWESKDVEQDRFIVTSKLVEGEDGLYHVYIYSGDSNVYYEPQA